MYNFNPTNDNDDDIFDDEKTLSNSNTFDLNNTSTESNPNLSNIFEEMFDNNGKSSFDLNEILNYIKQQKDFNPERLLNSFHRLRFDLIESFYNSANTWFFNYKNDNISLPVFETLSKLSDGKFPLHQKYYEMQINIIKRHIVCRFLKETFLSVESIEIFSKLSEILKINTTSSFITTYFQSFYDIVSFTMVQEIAMYKALANHLNLEVKDSIISGKATIESLTSSENKTQIFYDCLTSSLKESISEYVSKELIIYEQG